MPAQILTLTEFGREFLDAVDDREPVSVEARIEEIESDIESLRRENEQLREENQNLRRAVEQGGVGGGGMGGELDSLQAEIDTLQDRLRSVETHPVVASDVSPALIDAGVVLGNTCKKVLESELGEERVEKVRSETSASFEDDGDLLTE